MSSSALKPHGLDPYGLVHDLCVFAVLGAMFFGHLERPIIPKRTLLVDRAAKFIGHREVRRARSEQQGER